MATELRCGQVQRSAMNWPFFVALEQGFFADAGLEVEERTFTSASDPVLALIDGGLDVINVIPDVALMEMARGAPLCVIARTNPRAQYRLMAKAEIAGVGGLRGKKIGVNDGRSAESLILEKLLSRSGLEPGSYELVATGSPPERCERLREGLVDATMVTQPFDFVLEDGFKCLASSAEVIPHYPFTLCIARRKEEVREELVRFLRSIERAWVWICDLTHSQSAAESLSRYTKTSRLAAEKTCALYARPGAPPSLAPAEEGIGTMLELLVDTGKIALAVPEPRQFIDGRYYPGIENRK